MFGHIYSLDQANTWNDHIPFHHVTTSIMYSGSKGMKYEGKNSLLISNIVYRV